MTKNKTIKTMAGIAATSMLFWSLGAQAQNIVYEIERAFGGATVVGTIETDGHIGPLTDNETHIVSWQFTVDDGSNAHGPITFGSDSGGGMTGSGWGFLIATDTELLFDSDAAYAVGDFRDVQFFVDTGTDGYNYGWAAAPNLGWKKEQFAHFFVGGPHYAEDLLDGVEAVGRIPTPTDCSAPNVSLGEVMAGFQAGLTAGPHTELGPAGDYFVAFQGEDRRGFVIPENTDASQQCENDFILISGWFAIPFEQRDGTVLTPSQALDRAGSFSIRNGSIAGQRFEVDGVLMEHMNTKAKLGYLPNGRRVAYVNSGIVLEPGSLPVGSHSATITYELDFGNDGSIDFEIPFSATFKINPATVD